MPRCANAAARCSFFPESRKSAMAGNGVSKPWILIGNDQPDVLTALRLLALVGRASLTSARLVIG
jgi:hypothetical protein